MEQKEMSSCVQEYIEDLSDPHRAAILLHDVQGLTNPEIAAMLGVSLATVKMRLHRARSKLRVALGEGCSFSEDERGVRVCEPKPSGEPQGAE
jgi:RNA polymerase sigma-70 factor (ECF subfamily)